MTPIIIALAILLSGCTQGNQPGVGDVLLCPTGQIYKNGKCMRP